MNRILLASLVLSASWPAWASAESQVIDKAKMFSEGAVQTANQSFKDFHRRTKFDVVVETIPNLQAIDPRVSAPIGASEADKVLAKYCDDRVKSKGVQGLFILICRDPAKMKYESSRNSINPQQSKMVANAVMASLKNREFDQALADVSAALERVEVPAMSGAAAARPAAKEAGGGLSMIWTVLLIGVGLWLLVGLMRGLSSGGGGGGFMQSMLGGMFGGMAGMWMYDSFFRGGGGFGGGDSYDNGSSGGGDWGDSGSSGGGDWGSGGDYGASGDF